MAGSIYAWSTTAASNDTADGDINWQENQLPDTVNNSARQMMGRLAEFRNDVSGWLASGGTANSLTLTANSAFTSLAPGRIVAFRAAATNTGAASINVNALGSKAIRKMDSTGDVALVANDIRINGIYTLQYSTALDGGSGAWLLLNPTLSAAIYALSGLVTVDNTVPRFNGTAGALQTSGVTIDDSNNVFATSYTGSQIFQSNTTTLNLATTGAGNIFLRPNGFASTSGQFTVSASGDAVASGNSFSAGFFASTTGNVVLQGNSGTLFLWPNAGGANGTTIDASGNMTINGTLTVTG